MTDHDGLYKELLKTFFKEFMELFFPEAARWIDFTYTEFLSEEIVVDIKGGTRKRLDILIKTRLKGKKAYILVHKEPQAYYEKAFPERMFLYAARLYEKHRLPVLPIAILSYKRKKPEPEKFGWSLPFLEVMQFRYYRLQLRRYKWRDFMHSNNPVAAALLSSMDYNESDKVQMKVEFVRMMTRLELNPAKMHLLAVFFDTYLPLKEKEEQQVWREIEQVYGKAGEEVMEWKTTFEKYAEKRGRKEGKEEVAVKLLKLGVEPKVIETATGLTAAKLAALKGKEKGAALQDGESGGAVEVN
ncbi:Rpn family recombination-promoting nuclease/putative transposase [Paenibacillus sp. YN15]|uniref:Rpn family recombination-promoting nuclease/putative transposase n=1 Tax=Paenibacillus sp. YN15 TaxID=1742774 RepID=UPI0015ECB57B|nr:Rpn family recombination-promoting nuclease/putative transposase [Paenibacillus sp. YN15]